MTGRKLTVKSGVPNYGSLDIEVSSSETRTETWGTTNTTIITESSTDAITV